MSFNALHSAMDNFVDQENLSGVSSAIIVDGEIADSYYTGWADRENNIPTEMNCDPLIIGYRHNQAFIQRWSRSARHLLALEAALTR